MSDYFLFQSTFDFLGGFLEAKRKDVNTNLLSHDRFDISTSYRASLMFNSSHVSDYEFSIYLLFTSLAAKCCPKQ